MLALEISTRHLHDLSTRVCLLLHASALSPAAPCLLISKSAAFTPETRLQAPSRGNLQAALMKIAYPLLFALAVAGVCGQINNNNNVNNDNTNNDNTNNNRPSPSPDAPTNTPSSTSQSPSSMDDVGWTGAMNGTGGGNMSGSHNRSGSGSGSTGGTVGKDKDKDDSIKNDSAKTSAVTASLWIVAVSVVLSLL